MRGASGVEGIFILFLVEFEGVKVNSESSFFGKTFQLTAMSFELVKLISVPGGGVGEGDEFRFFRGDDVKTGGECIIIEIDQGSGGDSRSRGRGRDGGGQGGGERGEVDELDVPEYYGAFLLNMGGGDVDVQGDSQVVRDGEVDAG